MSLFSDLFCASERSGRPVISLFVEMLRLRLSGNRLGLSEYFNFQLYLNDLSLIEKRRFVGWAAQAILEDILVDDYSRFLSLDKVTMYALLSGYKLPIPALHAVYRSIRPNSLVQLESRQALGAYFAAGNSTPVYLKPAFGAFGRGNTLILGADGSNLILGDGTITPFEDFCDKLDDRCGLGWLLQEPLEPHSAIARISGNKISGIRVHTFLTKDQPLLIKAVWKINVGKGDTDNFQHGSSGNMLAAIDINTGRVDRVVAGLGFAQKVNPHHPVTGALLTGFQIPHWAAIKTLVCDAQLAFPGFICPGWDIAVCEDGPKILEINFFGDVDLVQHSHRAGFLDEEFLSLMRNRGLESLLSSASGNREQSRRNHRFGRRKHHWPW